MQRKKRKIRLVKLENAELEKITCKSCKYFCKIKGSKLGICELTREVKYETERCNNFTYNENERIASIDLIAEAYDFYKREKEAIQRKIDLLRDAIISITSNNLFNFKTEVLSGDKYAIVVQRVKSERLDTKSVKRYLKELGVLENFLKFSEYIRVDVKRK